VKKRKVDFFVFKIDGRMWIVDGGLPLVGFLFLEDAVSIAAERAVEGHQVRLKEINGKWFVLLEGEQARVLWQPEEVEEWGGEAAMAKLRNWLPGGEQRIDEN